MDFVDVAFQNAQVFLAALRPLHSYSAHCTVVLDEHGVVVQSANPNQTAVAQACFHRSFLLPGGTPFRPGRPPLAFGVHGEALAAYLKARVPRPGDVVTLRVSADAAVVEFNLLPTERVLVRSGDALGAPEPAEATAVFRQLNTFGAADERWLSLEDGSCPRAPLLRRFAAAGQPAPLRLPDPAQRAAVDREMRRAAGGARAPGVDAATEPFTALAAQPLQVFHLFGPGTAPSPGAAWVNRSGFGVSLLQENPATDCSVRILREEMHRTCRELALMGSCADLLAADGVVSLYAAGETGEVCFVCAPEGERAGAQDLGNGALYLPGTAGRAPPARPRKGGAAPLVEVLHAPAAPVFARLPLKLLQVFTAVESHSHMLHFNLREGAPLTLMLDVHPAVSLYAHLCQTPTAPAERAASVEKMLWLRAQAEK